MNNWFNIGGGPCTLPRLGCGPWIVVIIGLMTGICLGWLIDVIRILI